jgi:hypothetical protein
MNRYRVELRITARPASEMAGLYLIDLTTTPELPT